jgi:hypothetical protein
MANPIQNREAVSQLVGPYEAWVFGDGKNYSGDIGGALSPYMTALGELPSQHPLLRAAVKYATQTRLNRAKVRCIYTPTLWEAGFANRAPSNFVPLVIELQKPLRDNGVESLQDDLSALAALGSKPTSQHGFSLNTHLHQASLDADFPDLKTKPMLKPDTALLKRLRAIPLQDTSSDAAPLAIVAVIDDLLPFAHRNTWGAGGAHRSRMEFCWLQSADIADVQSERTVLFGREHTRHSIEALLKTYGIDEDALYGASSTQAERGAGESAVPGLWSHGAAVLDIAAGHRHEMPHRSHISTDGDMDRVRLIGVELPLPSVMDTIGFGKDCYILSAFHYIFDRADTIEAAYGVTNIPLIINFSFGFTGGPHDGCDRLEQAIQGMITAREKLGKPTKLVMPSGNSFHAALYSQVSRANLDIKGKFTIPWRVQPNDQTSSYLEMWYPTDAYHASGPPPLTPKIVGPNGEEPVLVARPAHLGSNHNPSNSVQKIWQLQLNDEIIGQLSLDFFRNYFWRGMLILAPTEVGDAHLPVAPAGLWRIILNVPSLKADGGFISCRIQRDSSPVPSPLNGRQSYFDYANDQVYQYNDDGTLRSYDQSADFVRRFGTLNGLSTHSDVFVVGGFIGSSQEVALYSSAGQTSVQPGLAGSVTCAAMSDDSHVLSGQMSAGLRSGSCARIRGTSGASPHVARAMAIGYLEVGTPKLIRNTPIKGMILAPLPSSSDQTKQSKLRLGLGMTLL